VPNNWRSIEFKHLRALRAIARTGTFWAAAEDLSASISTVSDHIAGLEALVGQRLLERSRGRRTVELTEAGRLLLGHAEAIASRLQAAEADFRAYAAGLKGSLRVGIYQSVANKILPEAMRRFKERWPGVDVQVTEEARDDDLVAAVERGDLDLTFAIEPIGEGPFEVRDVMRDPYVLVTATDSPLTQGRVGVADLDRLPMVAYHYGKHQDRTEEFLRASGARPRVVFRSNDNGTVQAMVAAGIGFALSPLLAVDESDPAVRLRQLVESVPPRVLLIVWHRDRYRPPAAAAFVETAVGVASAIEREHTEFLGRLMSHAARAGRQRRAPGRRLRPPASRSA
jgi:molybdate transport repressor ModE-like protein